MHKQNKKRFFSVLRFTQLCTLGRFIVNVHYSQPHSLGPTAFPCTEASPPGGGGYPTKLCKGGSTLKSKPLPFFNTIFDRKGVPFIPSIKQWCTFLNLKWHPFHIPTSLVLRDILIGPLKYLNDGFPTLQLLKSLLFYIPPA